MFRAMIAEGVFAVDLVTAVVVHLEVLRVDVNTGKLCVARSTNLASSVIVPVARDRG
jgi:hypothetical protein